MDTKNNKRNIFNTITKFHGTSTKVFPLLCPTKEYDWIDGWSCDLVYSNSGYAEELCIFKTDLKPFGAETWICSQYEPSRLIHYIRFSEDKVIRMNISLLSEKDGYSEWNWEYTFTALNSKGESFISGISDSRINEVGKSFMQKINYYLETGKMFK